MAVDDSNIDGRDLEDLHLDDLEKQPFGLSFFDRFPESQLCVPPDPLEDLEWFPNFSDDLISLSDMGLLPNHEKFSFEAYELPSLDFPATPMLQDEKTKQQTEGMRLSSHNSGEGEPNENWIGFVRADLDGFKMKKTRTKKRCTKMENQKTKWSLAMNNVVRKRCSHCLTEQTPQWRAGPMGPKTLCNACGVRFKSGRLVPEYRPAASPTFDNGRHSNFHKKIMKKRGLIV